MRTLTVLVLVAAIANVASAAITMQVVEVDNTAQLTGYVTQDIVVTTDTDWLGAHLVVQPDANGSIYQDALGDTDPRPPNPAFFTIAPSLEFDTYLMPDWPDAWVPENPPWSGTFDVDAIDVSWHTGLQDEIGELALARLTLAGTATGTWSFMATAAPAGSGPMVEVPAGVIENGVMYIPEPTTLLLLGMGGLAVIRRRSLLTK